MNWTKNWTLTSIATNFNMREYLWKASPILEAILVRKMLHTLVELALTLTVLFGSLYISFYTGYSIYRGYCRQNIPISFIFTPPAIPKYLTGALFKIHRRPVMVRSVVPILEKFMPNTGSPTETWYVVCEIPKLFVVCTCHHCTVCNVLV